MADNVLGVLFGDIADAIRSKTGDTATMKPAEFPEKIEAIETGGGSSGVVTVSKYFTPTSGTSYVVEHGLGVVPDIAVFFASDAAVSKTAVGIGMSKAAADAGFKFPKNQGYYTTSSGLSKGSRSGSTFIDDPGDSTTIGINGMPFCDANESTIRVCSYSYQSHPLYVNKSYYLYLIGGLT